MFPRERARGEIIAGAETKFFPERMLTFNWKEYFEGIDCQEIVRRTSVTFIILVSRNLRERFNIFIEL